MRQRAIAALSGVLFAIGLGLSGMTDPSKVLAFLDVTGDWDPSLAFVMGGAVGFHLLWLRLVAPRLAPPASTSTPTRLVDTRLVVGAAVFGVGWGLCGYCPGPAIAAAASGRADGAVFLAAMLAGVLVFHRTRKPKEAPSEQRRSHQ